jgi:type II secretory ATPase GspE/PulE/Tfp pilus assembly ATPase PilB-like protein
MLRQDPNIIMVGEIRDEDTANISVNAALTGHLLLSTLHTNDAATTLPRLLDMKIEPFLISSTVNIAIAQRLVRKICPECKVKKQLTAAQLKVLRDGMPENIDIPDGNFFIGKGCSSCNNHGYWGRIGIYEVMEMSDDVRTAITNRASANELKKVIVKNGMTTVLQDGMQKARAGITTIEEVLRVMHE